MTSWEETTTREIESGLKITRSRASYNLEGSINGETSLDYSMVYLTSHMVLFLGFELISGTMDGRPGTLVLRHDGKFNNGVADTEVQIVPGSGTGALSRILGRGQITSDPADPRRATLELVTDPQ